MHWFESELHCRKGSFTDMKHKSDNLCLITLSLSQGQECVYQKTEFGIEIESLN